MSNTYIKDSNNRTIGVVRTQGNITRLNDSNNRTVATYNNKTNVTLDRNNKVVGSDNQLLRVRF